jgi:preprotein translocase subunit YajC
MQTTFKKIKAGDKFGTSSGYLGTVEEVIWIEEPLLTRVQVKTEYGYEIHPINQTVLLLHEAKNTQR